MDQKKLEELCEQAQTAAGKHEYVYAFTLLLTCVRHLSQSNEELRRRAAAADKMIGALNERTRGLVRVA